MISFTALAVARDKVRSFAAACRMANVNGVAQIEMLHDRSGVRSVVVHVVPIADLARPAVAPPVMSDDAIPFSRKYSICVSQSSALSGQP